jgi:CheY-like chemotaxis protein
MPVIFAIHPEKEELSKVRHILAGRDYMLVDFSDCSEAERNLAVRPPDVCLMRTDVKTESNQLFLDVLRNRVQDCPVIILTDKQKLTDDIKLVGDKNIYDYFILQPVVDPLRLHIIIDKALSQTSLSLNLENLKKRLADLPELVPVVLEEQVGNLQKQVSQSLFQFKDRMKSDEFQNIINLLDEKAFDGKFEDFEKNEIQQIIEQSKTSVSDVIRQRLTSFTVHLKQQLDAPPNFNELQDMRKRISGEIVETENLKQDLTGTSSANMKDLSTAPRKTILLMDDEATPTNGLAEAMEKLGHKILTAHSPRKLIEMLRSQQIDMLVCGYNLTGINGIELVRRIKEGLNKAALPVILLTSNPSKEIMQLCDDVGITDIVSLPLIPKKLEEKIKIHLK